MRSFCLIISILFLLGSDLSAQVSYVKNKSLGPGVIWTAMEEPNGGLTVAARFIGPSLRPALDCPSEGDDGMIWLARLDSNWDVVWEQCYGGSGDDFPEQLFRVNDTTIALFVTTDSEDGTMAKNQDHFETGVLILNDQGELKDSRFYGGSAQDGIVSVIRTSDGGFLLGCNSNSRDGDVMNHYGPGIDFDAWILKLSSDFQIEWSQKWGGSESDASTQVIEWIDSSYAAAMYSWSTDYELDGYGAYESDVWLVKFSNDGEKLWQQKIAESDHRDTPHDILVASDSTIMVVGKRDLYWCDSIQYIADLWVTKIDAAGDIIWDACLGDGSGGGGMPVYSIVENKHGYIIIARISEVGGDVSNHYGLSDMWIAQLDTLGKLLWEKNLGGSDDDFVPEIMSTNRGTIIGYGGTASTDYDLDGVNSDKYYATWIFELDITAVGNNRLPYSTVERLKIYPVPAKEEIVIEEPGAGVGSWSGRIVNTAGKTVWANSIVFNGNTATITVSGLPDGMYYLEIYSGKQGERYGGEFVLQE